MPLLENSYPYDEDNDSCTWIEEDDSRTTIEDGDLRIGGSYTKDEEVEPHHQEAHITFQTERRQRIIDWMDEIPVRHRSNLITMDTEAPKPKENSIHSEQPFGSFLTKTDGGIGEGLESQVEIELDNPACLRSSIPPVSKSTRRCETNGSVTERGFVLVHSISV